MKGIYLFLGTQLDFGGEHSNIGIVIQDQNEIQYLVSDSGQYQVVQR